MKRMDEMIIQELESIVSAFDVSDEHDADYLAAGCDCTDECQKSCAGSCEGGCDDECYTTPR